MAYVLTIAVTVVDDDGYDPIDIASGVMNWIDDCDGVIDSKLVDTQEIEDE